jgi:rare lipoprotein A
MEFLRIVQLTSPLGDEIINGFFCCHSMVLAPASAQLMTHSRILAPFAVLAMLATGCGIATAQNSPAPVAAPAVVATPAPVPAPAAVPAPVAKAAASVETGKIAWYGKKFAGRRTASGESFNPEALTMAHKTLPFGTRVKVTNLANKKSVILRVNDRGPTQADRVGDVSLAAARALGMVRSGVADAELEVVSEAPAKRKQL